MKQERTHKDYLEFLRGMTPGERWDKAFELTSRAREAYRGILRQHYPELNEREFAEFYATCCRLPQSLCWSPDFREEFISGKV